MNNRRGIFWKALALVAFLGGCDSVPNINHGTGGKGGTGGKITGSGGSGTGGKGAGGSGAGGSGAGGSSAQTDSGAGGTLSTGGATPIGQGGTSDVTPGSGGSVAGGGITTGGAKASGGSGTAGSTGTGGTSATGGSAGNPGVNCTKCHGDSTTNNPAPPSDTSGESATTSAGVGAHAKHLATSPWHRQGKCADCHTLPTSGAHSNDVVDFTWGSPSNADNAKPAFDTTALSCSGAYCHGTTLTGASSAKTTPVWNQVNETWNACGTACHMTPPPASTGHPASTACETCHSKVIASFKAGTPATVVWKDASLHVNGTVEVDTLTCTSCHGSGTNAAPPKDTQGNTATTAAGVGAHAQHLAGANWHRQGQCGDCHTTPTANGHSNGKVDFTWGGPSNAGGAVSSFTTSNVTCSGVYCHGSKMKDQAASIIHAPVWNKVDGSQDACGKSCHGTPPGGTHTTSTACENCHGDVISKFNGANSTWKDATKHINGTVEKSAAACGSCHAIPPSDNFHNNRKHSVNATNCDRCHTSSTAATHNNGTVNVSCSQIPGYRAGGPCHGGD